MVGFVVHFRGLEEALRELGSALDDEVDAAMESIGGSVATMAKQIHGFKNRTGDLEASIRYELLSPGRFLAGPYQAVIVIGDTHYGEYMEFGYGGRFSYLVPAYNLLEPSLQVRLDAGLSIAASRAGMAP